MSAPEKDVKRRDKVVVGLALLCLVLAGALVGLVVTARPDSLDTAPNGQVTSAAYRKAAMEAASVNASTILSYGYRTLAQDKEAARAVMTEDFAEEYDEVIAAAATEAADSRLTLRADVRSSAISSLTKDRAVVLLFVNAVTTTEGSKQELLNQNRVQMTMTREDGEWVVSKMDAF